MADFDIGSILNSLSPEDMENIKNLVDEIIIPDLGDVYYKKIIDLKFIK